MQNQLGKRDEKQMKLEESNRYNERKQSASNRRRQIGIDENKFNVVIAGATGVGKSSGVNALIGKVSGEKDSAEESDTGETTMDLRVFNNAKIHSNITGIMYVSYLICFLVFSFKCYAL